MKLQRFTNYLLTHRVLAFILTLAVTSLYILPGSNLLNGPGEVIAIFINSITGIGMIYATLVTLVQGPAEGAIFTLAATVPYVIVTLYTNGVVGLLPNTMAGVFLLSNILTWVFAVLLYKKATWSQILQIGLLLGVFAVSVIHLVYPDVVSWWTKGILDSLNQFKQVVVQNGWDQAIELPDLAKMAAETAPTATGCTVAIILVVNFLQLVVARWWQAKVFAPKSLGPELRNIHFGWLAGMAFIACMLLIGNNSVLLDMFPVFVIMFAMAGLSLVHYFFSLMPRTPSTTFLFILIYTAIIFGNNVSAILLAILALFDVGLDVRRRIKKV